MRCCIVLPVILCVFITAAGGRTAFVDPKVGHNLLAFRPSAGKEDMTVPGAFCTDSSRCTSDLTTCFGGNSVLDW